MLLNSACDRILCHFSPPQEEAKAGASLCQNIQLTKDEGDPFCLVGAKAEQLKKKKSSLSFFQVNVLDNLDCQQVLSDFRIVDL